MASDTLCLSDSPLNQPNGQIPTGGGGGKARGGPTTPVNVTGLVATDERPSAAWGTNATVVQDNTAQIVGRDVQRRSVTVIVDPDAVSDVYLLPNQSTPIGNGLRLKPGAGFQMNTAAAIYARCFDGESAILYVVVESGVA